MADVPLYTFQPHEIARLSLQMENHLRPSLFRSRLTVPECLALTALLDGEAWGVTKLAEHCGQLQPTMTKALNKLKARGFIEQRKDTRDGRMVLNVATAKGRKLAVSLLEAWPQQQAEAA